MLTTGSPTCAPVPPIAPVMPVTPVTSIMCRYDWVADMRSLMRALRRAYSVRAYPWSLNSLEPATSRSRTISRSPERISRPRLPEAPNRSKSGSARVSDDYLMKGRVPCPQTSRASCLRRATPALCRVQRGAVSLTRLAYDESGLPPSDAALQQLHAFKRSEFKSRAQPNPLAHLIAKRPNSAGGARAGLSPIRSLACRADRRWGHDASHAAHDHPPAVAVAEQGRSRRRVDRLGSEASRSLGRGAKTRPWLVGTTEGLPGTIRGRRERILRALAKCRHGGLCSASIRRFSPSVSPPARSGSRGFCAAWG